MREFEAVGAVGDFGDPSTTLVEVDDEPVLLIHAAGGYYALDDVCSHANVPLEGGALHLDEEPAAIACSRHGAKFALAGGAALSLPATKPVRSHEVKVEDGQVFVRLCE